MEWQYEPATFIPAEFRGEHLSPSLSQIGVLVYDDGLLADARVSAETLIAQIPLVIGVSAQNLCDYLTFIADSMTRLTPDLEAIMAWCPNALERGTHHQCQSRLSSVQA